MGVPGFPYVLPVKVDCPGLCPLAIAAGIRIPSFALRLSCSLVRCRNVRCVHSVALTRDFYGKVPQKTGKEAWKFGRK